MGNVAACVAEYFSEARIDEERKEESSKDPIYKGFKTMLDLKANEEALVSPVLGNLLVSSTLASFFVFSYRESAW